MAMAKAKLEKRMDAWSDKIVEHLSKCAMYCDSLPGNKYNHWIEDELATWLSDVNETTCKHNGKKLKPSQYESILFGWLGDELSDARSNLHDLQLHNSRIENQYPYVKVDEEMVRRMYEISRKIIEVFVPILSVKNSLTKKDIEKKLHEIIDPVCLQFGK